VIHSPRFGALRCKTAGRVVINPRAPGPNSFRRHSYYGYHWPHRSQRDLIEHPGRTAHLWSAADLTGLVALVLAVIVGPEESIVHVLNLCTIAILLVLHAGNSVRSRRRRSMLQSIAFASTLTIGALGLFGWTRANWDDLYLVIAAVWATARIADLWMPRATYLERRSSVRRSARD
jgi:hypothetical protein